MTPRERLAAIEAREKAATVGPWVAKENNLHAHGQKMPIASFVTGYEQSQKDAVFAAHARADVLWLLARLKRTEALLRCTTDQDPRWMRTIEDFLDGAEDESK